VVLPDGQRNELSGTRKKDEIKRELGLTHRPPGLKSLPKAAKIPEDLLDAVPADEAAVEVEVEGGSEPPPARPSHRPSAPPTPEPVATFGRYGLLGRLATGGMADIYLAEENMAAGEKRYAVIKLVKPILADDSEFDEMFVREGRVAMRLAHPNICHVYEFGRIEDRFFIAMEYVDGVTLRDLVRRAAKRGEDVPVPILVRIIADIAEALDFAHRLKDAGGRSLGVVHRDVSPHNMMVSFEGVVKLLDFGVAKDRTEASAGESGTVKGKFAYMSPEQCSGQPVDGRSDVFALGICLFEALSGRLLYKRDTQYDTFKAIIEEAVPSVLTVKPTVPAALDVVVRKALAKDPAARFQTAGAFQEALEKWLVDARETVNAARIARVVAPLFADEMMAGPQLERGPEIAERLIRFSSLNPMALDEDDLLLASDPPAVVAPAVVAPPPPPRRRPGWIVPAVIGAVVALALAAAFAFFASRDDSPPAAAAPEDNLPLDEAPEPSAEPDPPTAPPEQAAEAPAAAETADDPPTRSAMRGERPSMRPETAEMRVRGNRSPGFVTDPGF
jgi:serine/threonine-protein kinase